VKGKCLIGYATNDENKIGIQKHLNVSVDLKLTKNLFSDKKDLKTNPYNI
jgi:hypothetical protein